MPRHGGAGNTAATTPTQQGVGVVALANLAAGASAQVTITDKDILAGSIILCTVANLGGDATAGRMVTAHPNPPAAGSCVVDVSSVKLMTGTWVLWYQVIS